MNEKLLGCAQINFQNCEQMMPFLKQHPIWQIAMAQLEEGLGGKSCEETLAPKSPVFE